MTDTKPEAGADPEASRVQSIADQIKAAKDEIMGEVRQLVGAAKSGASDAQAAAQRHEAGKLERPSDAAEGLEAMVDRALGKVLGDQQRKAADDAHAAQHAALEAAAAEKTPTERTWRQRMWSGGVE